jgi:carboxyl-terminal processing protease
MTSRRTVSLRLAVLAALALAVGALLGGIWLGGQTNVLPRPLQGGIFESRRPAVVNQALNILATRYYRPLERSLLIDQALSGMVASLDDPYSRHLDAQAYRERNEPPKQDVGGIGITTIPEPRGLRVRRVFPDSPAAKAGVLPGDLIVKVGSTSLADQPDHGSGLIQGPVGTAVELTLRRGDADRAISMKRAHVVMPVVTWQMLTYQRRRIGHLILTGFSEGANDHLRAALRSGLDAGAQAIILDLRGNGGGLINESIDIASAFVQHGEIMSAEERGKPRRVYMAKRDAIGPRIPMVVLVDHGTASAAEILTSALQDHGRAEVVGTETHGKGVFQVTQRLINGGALDITVGRYFSPNGHNLGGDGARPGPGITPNVHADDDPMTPRDEALAVAERTVTDRLSSCQPIIHGWWRRRRPWPTGCPLAEACCIATSTSSLPTGSLAMRARFSCAAFGWSRTSPSRADLMRPRSSMRRCARGRARSDCCPSRSIPRRASSLATSRRPSVTSG